MGRVTRIEFDGLEVRLLDDTGKTLMQAPAVSGQPLLQDPGFSKLKDKGPLPEGRYRILKQHIESRISLWDPDNIGWPRGYGYNRVTLLPEPETELHDRSGFFLHGSFLGNGFGSAGCIDLNTEDGRIFDLLRSQGAETIEVTVRYADALKTDMHPVFQDHEDLETLQRNALVLLTDAVRTQPEMAANRDFVAGVAGVLGQDGLDRVLDGLPGENGTGSTDGFDVLGNTPEAPLVAPALQASDLDAAMPSGPHMDMPLSGWQTVPGAAPVLPPRLAAGPEPEHQGGESLPITVNDPADIPGAADAADGPVPVPMGPGQTGAERGGADLDGTAEEADLLLPIAPPPTSYDTFLRLGATPEMEARGLAAYNALLRESYLDMNGDRDAAETLARERFLRLWRPSKFAPDPEGTLLPYPVETVYPPLGADGHGYVEDHARTMLTELGLTPVRIFLSPNDKTRSDWIRGATDKSGHGPRLTLSFEDGEGRRHHVTDAFQARVRRPGEAVMPDNAEPQSGLLDRSSFRP